MFYKTYVAINFRSVILVPQMYIQRSWCQVILRKGSRIYLPVLGIGFESWFGFEFLIVEIEEGNETSSANQKLRRGAIESSEMESSLGGGKQPLDV